jgi:hypothetical protein
MSHILSKRQRQAIVSALPRLMEDYGPGGAYAHPPRPETPPPDPSPRCTFTFADGRSCAMPASSDNPKFCAHHAHRTRRRAKSEQSGATSQALAAEILGPIRDFRTDAAINHVLGRVFTLLADNRIDARKASVLGYLCQLMQQSVTDVQREAWGFKQPPELQQLLQAIDKAPPSEVCSGAADRGAANNGPVNPS